MCIVVSRRAATRACSSCRARRGGVMVVWRF